MNYPSLPRDKGNSEMQEYPAAIKAKATFAKDNGSVSSVISFTDDTSALEISAVGGAAVMRWVATTDTAGSVLSTAAGANFDHVISANTTRRFAVPKESVGTGAQSVVGINREFGLYQRAAFKSVGIASVLTNEY